MSFLAPQAYTKETLAKAFDWLQHQPSHVAQSASTPDNLVALYLKAQRNNGGGQHQAHPSAPTSTMTGSVENDAPVSSKRFIDDLKNLRKDLATFEDESGSSLNDFSHDSPVNASREISRELAQDMNREVSRETRTSARAEIPNSHRDNNNITVNVAVANMESGRDFNGAGLSLDERSMAAIADVQARFNLSTPQEALRLLITVGHKHVSHWP